jgi:hypothetical protein
MMLRIDMDCAPNTSCATAENQYDASGEVVRLLNIANRWTPIAPGTIAEEEQTFLCQKAAQ